MASNVSDIITRTDTGDGGIIPVQYANEIIKNAPKSSVLLTRGRHVTMTSKQRKQPVLNLFPAAYWVNGDTGLKQTSKMQWKDLTITAEELAVIIPVPEAVIEDASIDLWSEITPAISESFGKLIDQAGIFGVGAPDSWPTAIVPGAMAAGNVLGTKNGVIAWDENGDSFVDEADAIAGLGERLAGQGFNMNGFASRPGFNWRLRRLRSTDGVPIYQENLASTGTSGLYGLPLNEVENGAWDNAKATLIGADWSQFLVGVRKDMTYKWLDQAVITDDEGKVILNLAQQDCVALRVVMRVGFAVANPINRIQPDEGLRFPAAVLATDLDTTVSGSVEKAIFDTDGDGAYSKSELQRMSKAQIEALCTAQSITVEDDDTKASLIDKYLAKQG